MRLPRDKSANAHPAAERDQYISSIKKKDAQRVQRYQIKLLLLPSQVHMDRERAVSYTHLTLPTIA